MVVSEFTLGKVVVKIHDDFVAGTSEQNEEILKAVNEHISKCLSTRNIFTPDNSVKPGRTQCMEVLHG